jgi:Flp pilus assembly protein TadB
MTLATLTALVLAFTAVFVATRTAIQLAGSAAAVASRLAHAALLAGVRRRIGRDLARVGRDSEPAAGWLTVALLEAGLFGSGVAISVAAVGAAAIPARLLPAAIALAGAVTVTGVCIVRVNGLRALAEARVRRMVRLLPYSVELIVLIAEAGGSLEDGLAAVVDSMPAEPLCDEFARLLTEQRLGRPFIDALQGLGRRIDNKELTQLVTSIEIGRDLGTPIAASLSSFAEWIRTKRVLDGERLAREAAPKMALPNTMIMAANVLLILAPFLPALSSGGVL